MIDDLVTHVIVSSAILAAAIAAAAWIRPLTARTRHAILVAGMAALALPSFLVTNLVERNAKTLEPILLEVPRQPPGENPGPSHRREVFRPVDEHGAESPAGPTSESSKAREGSHRHTHRGVRHEADLESLAQVEREIEVVVHIRVMPMDF